MSTAQPAATFGIVEDSDEDFAAFSRVVERDAPGTSLRRWQRAEATLASLAGGDGAAADGSWPSILVVDLNLPGIDGCELVRRLRANAATRTLPIFVLSGSARQTDIDRCYAAGANAYLTKPGSSAELRSLLQMLFRSLACFRAPTPVGTGPVEIEAVDDVALEEERAAYEAQLLVERDAARRGRERAEALQRIAVRLAGLSAAAEIQSALVGELIGSDAVDRAEVTPVLPGSAPVDAFFAPQLMAGGTTGVLPVLAPSGASLAQLKVETSGEIGADQQSFLAEAAALAGQALDRSARMATVARRQARAGTDLPAQRWWTAAVERELRRVRGTSHPLTVVAVEIDSFDKIVAQHGAVTADRLLLSVLDGWRQAGHDLLSTHGGEEFSAILPGLSHRQARQLIAEVRQLSGVYQSFSTGIAQWDQREDAPQLVARAEAALVEERRLRTLG